MIQLALIGVGSWGKNYISTVESIPDCRIKYLCAKTPKRLQKIQGDFIKTTNYKELFKYRDIDGIILATPNSTHFEIAREFIKRGHNLLIEKPMTQDLSQAKKLLDLQNKSGSKVLVGHTYLFDPAYKKTKEIVKTLGKIRYISYEGSNDGPYRKNTSTFWDVGSHAISLCLDIHRRKVISVSSWGLDTLKPGSSHYDLAVIRLVFSDGTKAFIKITWLFPLKRRELAIIGNKNTIIYDAFSDKRAVYFKNMITPKKINMLKKNTTKIYFPNYGPQTPLQEEVNEFVETIKDKEQVKNSTLKQTVEVVKVISMIEKSIEQNGKPQH